MVILKLLEEVPDPRDTNARHDLVDVLFVALAAMLCGAVHCTEMALFAEARLTLVRRFVPLKHGAPSHDTFTRILGALDPQAFEPVLQRFMAAFGAEARFDRPAGSQVAIDGKSLRRAYEKGRAHVPPMVVTAYSCDAFMSLSQQVAGSGGEAEAALAALAILSLTGATVSGDALHCHRRMTETIRARGGDYVLAVKGNQSKLAREANAALDKAAANPRTPIFESDETAHGREEVRRAFVIPFRQTPGNNALVDLCAVARVESWRSRDGKTTHKQRCYALSARMHPQRVLKVVRKHWAIENNLHWQLDVFMGEDQTRNRKKNAPANLAVLRRLALNVLQAEPAKIPLSHKRLKARWNDDDLIHLMTHMR
jgi:predicted transposase YbfD/YdcC